ncbi:MAG TPA: hypothetical protein VMS37_15870 [Verrucomicrobiae bacterium]|nr:hypothetical protein [Verrucomicrobiae bacterium]
MTVSRLVRVAALLSLSGFNVALADTMIFSDDFNGTSLNPSWQVQPGQGSYSVGGGNLRYYLQGPLSSPFTWFTTSTNLAYAFTGTDWEIDTKATYHLVWLDNSGNSTGAQAGQVLVSFNQSSPSSDVAQFGRGVDAWYASDYMTASYGAASSANVINPADGTIPSCQPYCAGVTNNVADGQYWYQIIRHGGSLQMNYSYDGITYNTALSVTLADPADTYNDLLLSATTYSTAGSYTDYDYVYVKGLSSTVPEPGAAILLGTVLAGLLTGMRTKFSR